MDKKRLLESLDQAEKALAKAEFFLDTGDTERASDWLCDVESGIHDARTLALYYLAADMGPRKDIGDIETLIREKTAEASA